MIDEPGPTALGCVADYACHVGENPLWHPLEKQLYWTDIPTGRMFRYDPAIGRHEQCYAGRPVGGFTIQADGSLLLFQDRGTVSTWRNGVLTENLGSIPKEEGSRFNDVIADPMGRVFCGTMSAGTQKGRLYRLDCNGHMRVVVEGIGCSNGMAFTSDGKTFLYTDSFARSVYRFDYEATTGSIGNQQVYARFSETDGLPDGCSLDQDDCLWVALWEGRCVVRLDHNGFVTEKIEVPALKVTSLTFGGESLSDLYITSGGGETKAIDGPLAGSVFCARGRGRGRQDFFSRVHADLFQLQEQSEGGNNEPD